MLHAERETFGRKGGLGGGDVKDSPVAVELVVDITTNVNNASSSHIGCFSALQSEVRGKAEGKLMKGIQTVLSR